MKIEDKYNPKIEDKYDVKLDKEFGEKMLAKHTSNLYKQSSLDGEIQITNKITKNKKLPPFTLNDYIISKKK